jgi:probable FeS assembly SUF system protein SufT
LCPHKALVTFGLWHSTLALVNEVASVELLRDCEALQIPHGSAVTLPKGTPVDITQTLGGSYTVHAGGGLYRIAAKDADALGRNPAGAEPASASSPTATPVDVDERQVWDTLRTCYDPEIPVNIVDLGLIYDLNIEKLPTGFSRVNVKMTLTAPGCGMGPAIAGDAQQKIMYLEGVEDASVEVVWDPPWHQSMITAEGRRILGLE